MKKNISVYILKLQDDKYYVGQSRHPEKRIKEHFDGKGSKWTQAYLPTEIKEIILTNTANWRVAFDLEKQLTLQLMRDMGWENVRGGGYSSCQLSKIPQELVSP